MSNELDLYCPCAVLRAPLDRLQFMEILNQSGARIIIEALYQTRTYAGLLAGTRLRSTQILLEDLSRVGRPSEWRDLPVVGLGLDQFTSNPDRPLPEVTCLALLVSMRVKDADSVLVAVWFQEAMFAPPAEEILDELRNLDWKHLAVPEYYYG